MWSASDRFECICLLERSSSMGLLPHRFCTRAFCMPLVTRIHESFPRKFERRWEAGCEGVDVG